MRKQLAVAAVTTAVGLATFTGYGIANAETTSSTMNRTDHMSSLVDAISSKFKLNKSDVQAVFDEQKTQMQTQRQTEFKSKLDTLVKDGKLTQTQADAITAKRTELQKTHEANRDDMQGKTMEERKTAMETERSALDTWFTDNGISTDYRYLLMGGGHHGGPMGMRDGEPGEASNR